MPDLKPFSNTVLINLVTEAFGSGVQDTRIAWQDWLKLEGSEQRLEVDKAVRKYHLNASIKYTYQIVSVIPDKILCAAIWYKPASLEIENPINIEFGTVFTGRRHSNCYEMLLKFFPDAHSGTCVDGFITCNNVFLTREEAHFVALRAGQIKADEGGYLISEMLY